MTPRGVRAHFNPVVSAADAWLGRGKGGLRSKELAAYVGAQVVGGIGGALLANAMFAVPLGWSTTQRGGVGQWLGEFVATAGLVFLIFALVRSDRAGSAPAAVGAYIGAAYWFTSSTSFANPAVTIARAFSDTFAGIAPGSILLFVVAQPAGRTTRADRLIRPADLARMRDHDRSHRPLTQRTRPGTVGR
ncbi:aquaporin [Tenggerimyces flavus]|uniref:Aquaporin n=1 Tax=Tenggerimyces flavus TaxID=1708749 RepID=A0ABV7Y452_9ACTN|nr:aquaporin [Tenggerimyces flavus]MBM7788391.1 glycerol uptake facilitator-like aquaporin [Tenggerimyces flavus]